MWKHLSKLISCKQFFTVDKRKTFYLASWASEKSIFLLFPFDFLHHTCEWWKTTLLIVSLVSSFLSVLKTFLSIFHRVFSKRCQFTAILKIKCVCDLVRMCARVALRLGLKLYRNWIYSQQNVSNITIHFLPTQHQKFVACIILKLCVNYGFRSTSFIKVRKCDGIFITFCFNIAPFSPFKC